MLKRILLGLGVVLSLAACDPSQYVNVGEPYTAEPAEDDPDWDCHIHGNKVCGPLTAAVFNDGRVIVLDRDGNEVIHQGIGDDGSGDLLVFLAGQSIPVRVFPENITYPNDN